MIKCHVSGQPRDVTFKINDKPLYHVKFEKSLKSPFSDLRSVYLAIKSLPTDSEVTIYNDNEIVIDYLSHRHDVKHERVQRWIAAIWSECKRKDLDVSFKFIPTNQNLAR